jgi:hypothetical protein
MWRRLNGCCLDKQQALVVMADSNARFQQIKPDKPQKSDDEITANMPFIASGNP